MCEIPALFTRIWMGFSPASWNSLFTDRWSVTSQTCESALPPHLTISAVVFLAASSLMSTSHTRAPRSEEHTSELQSRVDLVCRLLLEKKNTLHPPSQPSSLPKHP